MHLTPICLGSNLNFNQISLYPSQPTQFYVYYKGIKDPLFAKQFASDISVSKRNCFVCVFEPRVEVSSVHANPMECVRLIGVAGVVPSHALFSFRTDYSE